jgi:hypothetical protein
MDNPLFVVRTERGDVLFNFDADRYVVTSHKLEAGDAETSGQTIFDLRPNASLAQSQINARPGRYVAVY